MKQAFFLLIVLSMGCNQSPSQSNATKIELMSFGLQYHQFCDEKDSPPTSEADFLKFEDPYGALPGNQAASTDSKQAIASGSYVVMWGYDVSADLANNSKVILAYHKDVPENGGYVLFGDASVRQLSKQEFVETPKAGQPKDQATSQQ